MLKKTLKTKTSSFSIIITFLCLSIVGASLIPLLSVKLNPSKTTSNITINFSWKNASAKIIEQKVTAKIEGVCNTVKGIKKISSTSSKGRGSVRLELKEYSNIDAVRFEVANLIRQVYTELPKGVSYPYLSRSAVNENRAPILSYKIVANQSPKYIKEYAEQFIVPKLSSIKGVNKVSVFGAIPFEWFITYNSEKLAQLNLTSSQVQQAINIYLSKQSLGTAKIVDNKEVAVSLVYNSNETINWETIPINKIGTRTIYLGDIAKTVYREASPRSFYRINGLNTINFTVSAENNVNTIDLANTVKQKVKELQTQIDSSYSIKLTNDSSEFLVKELNKIQQRTLLSFIFLLILIVLINRSFKYLAILLVSIISNLCIAVIFYYLFKVELQLYSFAGITISFGIIIDNSIIMIDHIRNKGNKKAFLAILAATLTTIGALTIIFFLSKQQQSNLIDFGLVIAINIGVSLFTSLFLIPALIDKIGFHKLEKTFSRKRKRRIFRFTNVYRNTILWFKKPVLKWSLIIIFILGFGIPFHFLPKEIEKEVFYKETYNSTIGSEWFSNDVRPVLEIIIGGSLRLFTEDVFENSSYTEPQRTSLRVRGSMPDGCTIEQLNEAVVKMENFISQFEEVALFETGIYSHKNSSISIFFKEEFEFTAFPYSLKSLIESKIVSLGGLDWSVTGVGRGFSNALYSGHKSNKIEIVGYNYNTLYNYAEKLKDQLEEDGGGRVKDIEITSGGYNTKNLYEYSLNFDKEKLEFSEVSASQLYRSLKNKVHFSQIQPIIQNNSLENVKLVADNYQKFTVWDLKNKPITVNNTNYKLNQLATVEKTKTGNTIQKSNQQYSLTIAYDFLGTTYLANKIREEVTKKVSASLPLGYKILNRKYNYWNKKEKKQYYFLFIIIGIIFLICAVLLESLKQPFVIISMIPISFIGVFLTFYLFEFNFDQGGYASFILLCGISVNSALYIINDFNNLKTQYPKRNLTQLYFKAFNYKIIPVSLTIVSTIVGLIPFIWNGQNEAFWFSFAVGAIGGLIFSMLGIFLYLPLFLKLPKLTKNE